MEKIGNNNGVNNSLQISFLGDLPMGEFKSDIPFLIKNNNNKIIIIDAKLASMDEFITTSIYPGWNVELFKEVKSRLSDPIISEIETKGYKIL